MNDIGFRSTSLTGVKWLLVAGLLLALLLAASFVSVSASASAANANATFSAVLRDGATPQVSFAVHDAGDVYAYELIISFDALRLKLTGADAGHNGFLVAPIVEGDRIRIAHTLVGPRSGLAGDAELIALKFQRIAPGDAFVALETAKLIDADIDSVAYEPEVHVALPDAAASLRDIDGHWAQAAIEEAVRRGIVLGYADGAFRPQREVTRAEFAAMLTRALELPAAPGTLSFADAERIPAWAAPAIEAATKAGLAAGYADGTFRAERYITRAEMAAMLTRALEQAPAASRGLSYADAEQIPAWAQAAVDTAAAAGIMRGKPGNRFAPQELTTRAEAVTAILNLLKL